MVIVLHFSFYVSVQCVGDVATAREMDISLGLCNLLVYQSLYASSCVCVCVSGTARETAAPGLLSGSALGTHRRTRERPRDPASAGRPGLGPRALVEMASVAFVCGAPRPPARALPAQGRGAAQREQGGRGRGRHFPTLRDGRGWSGRVPGQ